MKLWEFEWAQSAQGDHFQPLCNVWRGKKTRIGNPVKNFKKALDLNVQCGIEVEIEAFYCGECWTFSLHHFVFLSMMHSANGKMGKNGQLPQLSLLIYLFFCGNSRMSQQFPKTFSLFRPYSISYLPNDTPPIPKTQKKKKSTVIIASF